MRSHRPPRTALIAATSALSTALLLAVTACAPTAATAGELSTDNHIHRLVPSDDGQTLLVGTHNGLFDVDAESGEVTGPVGEHVIDLMGLTRAGDDLLASGHPGESGPQHPRGPNLGLIRSSDDGRSWQPVSLEGDADFHALAYDPADQTIIGAHAGQLLITDDMGESWREGAVVEPYDLLATSQGLLKTSFDGLSISTDMGQTFQPIEGAPALALLANNADMVTGVDLDGTLWRSTLGSEWTAEGATPGQIHALTILPGGALVVATASGLQRSNDFGQSWEPLAP
ncbi:WD40/YVTN/BNR-like repeat-containing protein [Agrococcus sediminis]|uniref:WD40/YVTN/BNR-like repeat-containing protein n=1 Tax=Agrococcus sediminis TaxID=2599924 RepID=UPI00343B0E83